MAVALPAIAAAVGAKIAGASIAAIIGTFVTHLALTGLSRVLTKRDRAPGPPPLSVTVRNTVEHKRCLIGTRRIGGSFVFYRTSSPSLDEPNKYLWYWIAYIDHQCHDARDQWIDERQITDAQIDPSTGAVSEPSFAGKLFIWTNLGTQAQAAPAQLLAAFPSGAYQVTSADRLRGVCTRVLRMERDPNSFPNGPPHSCPALIDGALLYDMRLDSTNGGSGAHRRDNPSTWAFSRNWGLGVRHFLCGGSVVNDQATRLIRYGMKEIDARINDASFLAAANIADEQLTGGNAPPAGGQATRYTIDLEWSCGQLRREILNDLLAAGGPGTLSYAHGRYSLHPGAYDVPGAGMDFTQDDLVAPMQIDDTTDEEERVNAVAATFIDANNLHKPATTLFRTNAAYVTQDNGDPKPREISLRGVSNFAHAQRIAELELRRGRQMRGFKIPFRRRGLGIGPNETFNYLNPRWWAGNRVLRCIKREHKFGAKGEESAIIIAKVTTAAVHTDLLTAEYQSGTTITSAIQSEPPETPLSLTATTRPFGIEFNWTLGTFWQKHGIVRLWEADTDSFGAAAVAWEGRGSRHVLHRADQQPRFYFITIVSAAGQQSANFPATNGRQANATLAFATAEVFLDTFEHQQWEAYYNDRDNEAGVTITYPADGEASGRVIQAAGGQLWIAHKQNIPFDPTALYRITARIRRTAADAGTEFCYAGVEGVAADGITLINEDGANATNSQHYNCARGFDMGGVTLDVWRTFVGYFKGHATTGFGASSDPTAPTPLRTGVRYFRPLIILNNNDGDGTQQGDEIRVEKVTDTGGIEPNAATSNRQAFSAGPFSKTSGSAALILGQSFTAEGPGDLIVTCNYEVQKTTGTAWDGNALSNAYIIGPDAVQVNGPTHPMPTTRSPQVTRHIFPLAAGGSVNYGLMSTIIGSDAATWWNVKITGELVKR